MTDERFAGCVAELERRKLVPEASLAVLMVGSTARGWANPKSDYDIAVISAGAQWRGSGPDIAVPLEPAVVPTEVIYVAGRRWELKYYLDGQVDQMFGKVTWAEFEKAGTASGLLLDQEEVFLERLATCVPLSGAEWLRSRREQIDGSAFRAFVVTRSLDQADLSVEDALGQVAAGDLESAVLSARKAFGHAVDALLESLGEYGGYWIPKWRARRFRIAAPPMLSFADYWAIETMRDLDPADPGRWVEHVVGVCKDLSLETNI
jgi:predicted nucleotidyltransferase